MTELTDRLDVSDLCRIRGARIESFWVLDNVRMRHVATDVVIRRARLAKRIAKQECADHVARNACPDIVDPLLANGGMP